MTPYRFLVVYEYFRRTYIGLCSTLRKKKKNSQLISKVGKKRIYHAWFPTLQPATKTVGGEEIPCLPYGGWGKLNYYEHIFFKIPVKEFSLSFIS